MSTLNKYKSNDINSLQIYNTITKIDYYTNNILIVNNISIFIKISSIVNF